MRDHEQRKEGRPEDLLQELGYEPKDIQYKQFTKYAMGLVVFFLVCIVLGFAIMWFMVPTKLQGGRMANYEPKTPMPEGMPLLQTNISTRTDIMSLRRKETEKLTTAGVVDEAKGAYRIPVDTAIDLLSRRGLPKTPKMQSGGAASPSGGTDTPPGAFAAPQGGGRG